MSDAKEHNLVDGRSRVTDRPFLPPDMTKSVAEKRRSVDRAITDRLLAKLIDVHGHELSMEKMK